MARGDRNLTLNVDIDTDTSGARRAAAALDDIGDSAKRIPTAAFKAGDSLDDVGDSARGTAGDVDHLDARITRLTAHVREMGDEYHRTGSGALFKDIDRDTSLLTKLTRLRRQLAATDVKPVDLFDPSDLLTAGPSLKIAIVALGGTIAAGLAPVIGAAVGGAVTGAVGLGGIAGGIALAANDGGVRTAAKQLGRMIADDAFSSSRVFVDPTIEALRKMGDAWGDIAPDVRRSLEVLAPAVDDLAIGLASFVRQIMPGLTRAFENAGPVIAVMAEKLGDTGAALGGFLEDVSASEGILTGLEATFDILNGIIYGTGKTIRGLSDAFEWQTTKIAEVSGAMEDVAGWVSLLTNDIPGLSHGWALVAKWMEKVNDVSESWLDHTRKLGVSFNNERDSLGKVVGQQIRMTDSLGRVRQATDGATRGFEYLTEGLSKLLNQQLAVDNADIALQQSLADLSVELGNGKRTLDIHSQAGRDNAAAILTAVGAAQRLRDDQITKTPGAANVANAAYQRTIEKLIQMGLKAGFSRRELNDLVGNYRVTVTTTYRNYGTPPRTGSYADIPTGRIGGYAHGGLPPMDGTAFMVGEREPELMRIRGGRAEVLTGSRTRRMLSGATATVPAARAGGEMRLTVDTRGGGGPVDQAVAELFTYLIRTGKVSLTLAGNGPRVMAG